MTSPVQEIKDRLNIVDFIKLYIALIPSGKNFKAPCPFHKEKTPSFMVSPERQTWHCFGACGEGGDIFKFLMKYENLEFYEALKILAEKAGIELKKISPIEQKQFGVLYDINDSAKNFFKKNLERSIESSKYLLERGLKKETIEEFELGFSGSGFDELTKYLISAGFNIKDIERAGLNFKTERGSYVDRFRDRIMFPIHNHFGKVVGFSGRILPGFEKPEIGKYINSPETPIFNKSRLLYGFHKTKNNIREQKLALLVEGQMDFLMVYQDGIKNVAAVSGTALTVEHLKAVKRLADQLVLYFDNDDAGFNAAERSVDLAVSNDFSVKILTIKDYKDPAEAVFKSPGKLVDFLSGAKHAIEFYFEKYGLIDDKRQTADGMGNFKKDLRIVLSKIKNLASSIDRNYWIKELSLAIKIEENVLIEEMANAQIYSEKSRLKTDDFRQSLLERGLTLSRRELISQRMISLLMIKKNFSWSNDQSQIEEYFNYLSDDYLIILKSLLNHDKLTDERLSNLLNLISLRSSFEASVIDEGKIELEFQEVLRNLQLEYFKDKRQELICLIKEAEKKGNEEKVSLILKEFNEISSKINI